MTTRTQLHAVARIEHDFDVHVSALVRTARDQGHKIPCRPGCHECCYDAAFITPFEADLLVAAVKRLPREDQVEVRRRTQRWVKKMRDAGIDIDGEPTLAAYRAERAPCPLLDGRGVCRVYEARPLACRGHGVIDETPDACKVRGERAAMCLTVDEPLAKALGRLAHAHGISRIQLEAKMQPGLLGTMFAKAMRVSTEAP